MSLGWFTKPILLFFNKFESLYRIFSRDVKDSIFLKITVFTLTNDFLDTSPIVNISSITHGITGHLCVNMSSHRN